MLTANCIICSASASVFYPQDQLAASGLWFPVTLLRVTTLFWLVLPSALSENGLAHEISFDLSVLSQQIVCFFSSECDCNCHILIFAMLKVLQHTLHLVEKDQPCIPPGSLNRLPALAGVKAGKSPLPGGR